MGGVGLAERLPVARAARLPKSSLAMLRRKP